MVFSKLTSKHQATIPKEIRKLLHIKAGDRIIFEILPDNRVALRKVKRIDIEYLESLSSTLDEWNSKLDEDAYRDL